MSVYICVHVCMCTLVCVGASVCVHRVQKRVSDLSELWWWAFVSHVLVMYMDSGIKTHILMIVH